MTSCTHDGFVIVHDVVPADLLQPLRDSVDTTVARARATDPGWDSNPTPRSDLVQLADESSRLGLEFALHDNTFGVSAQALGCPESQLGVGNIAVLCSPEHDPPPQQPTGQAWGTDPRNWHRDIRPDQDGPLSEIIAGDEANGPSYVQWNIALYQEAILHVVPGSHRRLTSESKRAELVAPGGTTTALSGDIAVEFGVGDGVFYNNSLLHWGSCYSTNKRRTVHLGYRSFGNTFPHQRDTTLRERGLDLLPEGSAAYRRLARTIELFREEAAVLLDLYRAVLAGDQSRLERQIAHLHPAEEARLSCLIQVRIALRHLRELAASDGAPGSGSDVDADESLSARLQAELLASLSAQELDQLWRRFGPLDAVLQGSDETHVQGFLGPPSAYYFERLPAEVTIERAMAPLVV